MRTSHKFENREELNQFLINQLQQLNQKGEFIVFVHQINNFRSYWEYGGDIIKQKIDGIFNNGLRLSDYSSILGTTNIACASSQLNPDPIVDYDYHHQSSFPTCVIAIPKYIEIDGKQVEFPTYKYGNHNVISELRQYFNNNGINIDGHHLKSSLFDVIKGYNQLPTYYVLGVLVKREKDYVFIENSEHLKNTNSDQFQAYQKSVASKIKSAYQEYGTDDIHQLILKSYQKEQKWREAQLDDFD